MIEKLVLETYRTACRKRLLRKRIGDKQGKFGIDELFIWVNTTRSDLRCVYRIANFSGTEDLSYHCTTFTMSCDICIMPSVSLSWRYFRLTRHTRHRISRVRFFFRHALYVRETCTIDGKRLRM
ncbi:hypothetical protein RHSIM_Rhsim05G0026600 [Rhododendron simsii]|uniref:Uncharacterized protein n=1 Tax=Rhododendron simsii TaxID=118357 RepID=A0A834LK76_RHOSS|nr:hypothetical protein RHSIM_Rhsim05G0026600 [Rhododendron simsii]